MIPEIPDGPTEASTERDGAFSYSSEWHAFTVGFGVGVAAVFPSKRLRRFVWDVTGLSSDSRTGALKEARKESWYALGGMVFGMAYGVALAAFTVWAIGGVLT